VSRAFARNDAVHESVLIPPRPPLPGGSANYVTPRGMGLLRDELSRLEARRVELQDLVKAGSQQAESDLAVVLGTIAELQQRIGSARVIEPPARPHDTVRFGSTVVLKTVSGPATGEERQFTIVGVDEAAASEGRVAFTAPVARAVLGLQVGETGIVTTPQNREIVEVRAIG
jgi:transcription elongation factor GreB